MAQEELIMFVTVEDAVGKGEEYYKGYVKFGDIYTLQSSDGSSLHDGIHIKIYENNETIGPEFILQEAIYEASLCSNPLEMLDYVGASQFYEFTNSLQGPINFAGVGGVIDDVFTISAYIENRGSEAVVLQYLNMLEPSRGMFSYPNVTGTALASGASINVSQNFEVQMQAFSLAVVAATSTSGVNCSFDYLVDLFRPAPTVSPSPVASFSPSLS